MKSLFGLASIPNSAYIFLVFGLDSIVRYLFGLLPIIYITLKFNKAFHDYLNFFTTNNKFHI